MQRELAIHAPLVQGAALDLTLILLEMRSADGRLRI